MGWYGAQSCVLGVPGQVPDGACEADEQEGEPGHLTETHGVEREIAGHDADQRTGDREPKMALLRVPPIRSGANA